MLTPLKRALVSSGLLLAALSAEAEQLSLTQAVAQAGQQDSWQLRSGYQEQALRERAVSAGQLPDPKVRIGLANLPLDSFDFSQENMTQLQVGVSQSFPRGDTLELRQQRLVQRADLGPLERQLRRAELAELVARHWLNGWRAQAKARLIGRSRGIFSQLAQVAKWRYRSGLTERHDLLQAEIQLNRLDERVEALEQQRRSQLGRLGQWLPGYYSDAELPEQLPQLAEFPAESNALAYLALHPSVMLLESQIEIANTSLSLAEQAYQPAWTLGGQYGYRASGDRGSRADLASVYVNFDLPLFTDKRQDPQTRAAARDIDAQRESRLLQLRALEGRWQSLDAARGLLIERQHSYLSSLIPQYRQRRKAALSAYGNNSADFTEVMNAAIGELDAKLAEIDLAVDIQLNQLALNFLLRPEDMLAGLEPPSTVLNPAPLVEGDNNG